MPCDPGAMKDAIQANIGDLMERVIPTPEPELSNGATSRSIGGWGHGSGIEHSGDQSDEQGPEHSTHLADSSWLCL